ncbi:BCCT family transporter [Aliidiomarina maris]|uniref:Choline transporter n=1 Tax=Aliidiomarina maris TaxID=531312 RepID=A0A327WUI2_9GAMM|nr:BCCT family transporter [Aliidiomarina maris]MCL5049782.1 BCCT family transporter [Bacillota bacterium]RAJ95361.1 choline/glycine/proline betaine transport protein [Aliidiomarina maris]RUO22748.1 choline transporter [Aliidiomarina maris]
MGASSAKVKSTLLLPVFLPAIIVIALLIIGTISNPDLAGQFFERTLAEITDRFGWFYMLAVAIFLVFVVGIALTKFGRIKLGPDHAEPEYSFPAWFAMLFSAGYGIALLFFGVAEPVLHYADPPVGAAETLDSAKAAMQISFFHWGFHIWAIYGLTGLVLAYFAFRHGLPLSMRSALYPLIGDKIYGPAGHAVDTFAILGTMFGIATTLGLSVAQINAGVNELWGVPVNTTVQIIFIGVITLAAIASVVAGMDKGIKRLSVINMTLVMFLLIAVFVFGPTILLLETFLQNTGSYMNNIVERTFNLQAYERSDWIGNWTLFIFGWTIAWAPFVGLFIAKISRGRTIRQFVFGVMFVPTMFTFLWFSVFGDTALNLIMQQGYTSLIEEVQADEAVALFRMYSYLFADYPTLLTTIISVATVILIVTFFVTSSDSGSLVVDSLASGGVINTPAWQRVFWATLEGVVASVLLIAGGLGALQTASVASALPFAVIMLIAAFGMWRALIIEGHQHGSLKSYMKGARTNSGTGKGSWERRLGALVNFPNQEEVLKFIQQDVQQALDKLKGSLESKQWPAEVTWDDANQRVYLEVKLEDQLDFFYEVRLREFDLPDYAYPLLSRKEEKREKYATAEVFLRQGGQEYDVYGYNEKDLLDDVLNQFENYLAFLKISPSTLPWDMAKHDEDLDVEEHPEEIWEDKLAGSDGASEDKNDAKS